MPDTRALKQQFEEQGAAVVLARMPAYEGYVKDAAIEWLAEAARKERLEQRAYRREQRWLAIVTAVAAIIAAIPVVADFLSKC